MSALTWAERGPRRNAGVGQAVADLIAVVIIVGRRWWACCDLLDTHGELLQPAGTAG